MRAIRLIARRDWLATVCSPTGLIVVGLYLVLSGYVFWTTVSLTQEATLRYTFATLGFITAFVVPLITMRLFSEELRSGTFEILTAQPVNDVQIVLGKFLAGYLAFLALSAPTLSYVVILQILGSPDWGPALCAYLGQQLMAVMLLAMGLLASALTSNQVLAAMAATIGGILFWLAGTASASFQDWIGKALAYLAIFEQFSLFRRGIVDTNALTFFIATAAMFLYLSVRVVESRRWKFGVLPAGASLNWRFPRLSVALLIAAGAALTETFASMITRGIWTSYNTILLVAGLALAGTPPYLNRMRLRYELGRRRIGLVLTVVTNSLLVVVIWVLVAYFASRHYARLDLTSSKHYALSDQTRMVLDKLSTPVDVVVVMRSPVDLRQEIMDLLAEYTARSSRVQVQDIDPWRNPGDLESIRQRYKLTTAPSNEVLVGIGDQVRRIPVAAMVNQKLMVVENKVVSGPVQFVGEAEITAAILQLTRQTPGRIVFLDGHAERNPEDKAEEGASFITSQLIRNGWSVSRHVVTPGTNAVFPKDTSVVVIAGPQKKLSDEDLRALRAVLDRGGGVLALLDPGVSTGMEPLLQTWDVRLGNDIVVDLRDHVSSADATNLYVTSFREDDPIGKGMGGLAAVLPTTRRVAVTYSHPSVHNSNFVHTSGDGWAIAYQPGVKLQIDRKRDKPGPISLGVACERFQDSPEPGHNPLQGRLVVIGDSDFVTNRYVDMAGNLNLFLNCVDWLAGRQDLISVRPKVADVRRMTLTAAQTKLIFWLSVILVPGATMLLGVVLIGRRRYQA